MFDVCVYMRAGMFLDLGGDQMPPCINKRLIILSMEGPYKDSKTVVCMCVCVYERERKCAWFCGL